jgi:hypothetical protein
LWALFKKPTEESIKILPDWFKTYNKKQIKNPSKYLNSIKEISMKSKIHDKIKIEKQNEVIITEDEQSNDENLINKKKRKFVEIDDKKSDDDKTYNYSKKKKEHIKNIKSKL